MKTKSINELALILNVCRQSIWRYRQIPGSPLPDRKGFYDVDLWRDWLRQRRDNADGPTVQQFEIYLRETEGEKSVADFRAGMAQFEKDFAVALSKNLDASNGGPFYAPILEQVAKRIPSRMINPKTITAVLPTNV